MKKILAILLLTAAVLVPAIAQEKIDVSNDGPGVVEVEITNSGMSYVTKEIVVKAGDTLRLTFTNSGGFHDVVVEGYDVSTSRISAGQSETIEFVADTAGEFVYYCSVGNHRAAGMWGTLIVVD